MPIGGAKRKIRAKSSKITHRSFSAKWSSSFYAFWRLFTVSVCVLLIYCGCYLSMASRRSLSIRLDWHLNSCVECRKSMLLDTGFRQFLASTRHFDIFRYASADVYSLWHLSHVRLCVVCVCAQVCVYAALRYIFYTLNLFIDFDYHGGPKDPPLVSAPSCSICHTILWALNCYGGHGTIRIRIFSIACMEYRGIATIFMQVLPVRSYGY